MPEEPVRGSRKPIVALPKRPLEVDLAAVKSLMARKDLTPAESDALLAFMQHICSLRAGTVGGTYR